MHPLKCPICKDYFFLEVPLVRFEKNNRGVDYKVPMFKCHTCDNIKHFFPYEEWEEMAEKDRNGLKEGDYVRMVFEYERKKFERYDHLGFKYDPIDYHFIPGLERAHDEGYLQPVFFDKDLLLFYNNHPEYSVKLYSFSSGNIYYQGKSLFKWGFGINRNGKIFKWLGDLNEDFEPPNMVSHLKRFQASNIESDHDIFSTFYLSQNPFSPSDAFQSSDNENKIFQLKNKFELKVEEYFGFILAKIEVSNLSNYYKHPILEERHQVFSAYLNLSKYIIENIQTDELKNILFEYGVSKNEIKGLRSIKLFELFLSKVLFVQNIDDKITPLYVLYDLRNIHGHFSGSSSEEKYDSCKERLKAKNEIGDFDFFKVVISNLIDLYSNLTEIDYMHVIRKAPHFGNDTKFSGNSPKVDKFYPNQLYIKNLLRSYGS